MLCETPGDVSEAISFAKRHGLRAVPRSGGHCFAGRSSTGGVVIAVSPMRSVSVSDGVVTVGAGARLGDVYDALDEHGLTIPAGCGPDVGIAGLTLAASLHVFAPDDPDQPPVVSVSGSMLGPESDTRDLLDELVVRVGVDPTAANFEYAS